MCILTLHVKQCGVFNKNEGGGGEGGERGGEGGGGERELTPYKY